MLSADKATLVKALLLLVTVLVGVIVWMQTAAEQSPASSGNSSSSSSGSSSVGVGGSGTRNGSWSGSGSGSGSNAMPHRSVVPIANPIDPVTDWIRVNGTRASDEQLLAMAVGAAGCQPERPAAVVYLRVAGTGSGTLQAHTRRNAEATGRFTYAILGAAHTAGLTANASASSSGAGANSSVVAKTSPEGKAADLRALLAQPPNRVVAETDGAYVRLLPDSSHLSKNGTGSVAYVTLLREPLARAMALHRAACPTAASYQSLAQPKPQPPAQAQAPAQAKPHVKLAVEPNALPNADPKVAAAAAAKLKELCEKSFASFVSKAQPNPITRQICGSQPQCRTSAADALYIAKVRLVYTFSFVGVAERFQDSIKMLHMILPHFFSKSYDGSKIGDDFMTAAISSLSVADRNKFYQLHRYDAQLYSFARRLFEVKSHSCLAQAASSSVTNNWKFAQQSHKFNLTKQ